MKLTAFHALSVALLPIGMSLAACGSDTRSSSVAPSSVAAVAGATAQVSAAGKGGATIKVLELKGAVVTVGACPNPAITVGVTTVTTDAKTKFKNGVCADIKVTTQVEIKYTVVGGVNVASSVEIDNKVENENGNELVGAIRAPLTGTCTPDLSFMVGTVTVKASTVATPTTPATLFEDVKCGDLKVTNTVEVKGTLQADGTFVASSIELKRP